MASTTPAVTNSLEDRMFYETTTLDSNGILTFIPRFTSISSTLRNFAIGIAEVEVMSFVVLLSFTALLTLVHDSCHFI